MIPDEIVEFLDGATVGFAATRDHDLVPRLHRVEAWTAGDDQQTIVCLFTADFREKLLSPLEDNGQFAFTVLGSTTGPRASRPPNPSVDFHECYQFKGDFVASRSAGKEDLPLLNRKAKQFEALVQPLFGLSDGACAARFGPPVLAITFRVREIYDQTPGPGAGARIHVEEA